MGVLAETLMVVMRHADFATTQMFYGAMRSAQAAAAEVQQQLSAAQKPLLVGGLVGGLDQAAHLSADEVKKLKALLQQGIKSAEADSQVRRHPRSQSHSALDPTVLHQELQRISARLQNPELSEVDCAGLRDELGLLAGRCEWVTNPVQREFLQKQLSSLWTELGAV